MKRLIKEKRGFANIVPLAIFLVIVGVISGIYIFNPSAFTGKATYNINAVELTDCDDFLSTGQEYLLMNNVSISVGTCFSTGPGASDIILDCQGNFILTDSGAQAIYLSSVQNVTVKNCNFITPDNIPAVYIGDSDSNFFLNNTIYGGHLELYQSSENIIDYNSIDYTGLGNALELTGSGPYSNGNNFTNNYFGSISGVILIEGAENNNFINNTINSSFSGDAILLSLSSNTLFQNLTFSYYLNTGISLMVSGDFSMRNDNQSKTFPPPSYAPYPFGKGPGSCVLIMETFGQIVNINITYYDDSIIGLEESSLYLALADLNDKPAISGCSLNTSINQFSCSSKAISSESWVIVGSLDSDGDGVVDLVDNCPDVYNPGQENSDITYEMVNHIYATIQDNFGSVDIVKYDGNEWAVIASLPMDLDFNTYPVSILYENNSDILYVAGKQLDSGIVYKYNISSGFLSGLDSLNPPPFLSDLVDYVSSLAYDYNTGYLYAGGNGVSGGILVFYNGTDWREVNDAFEPSFDSIDEIYLDSTTNLIYVGARSLADGPMIYAFNITSDSWLEFPQPFLSIKNDITEDFTKINSIDIHDDILYIGGLAENDAISTVYSYNISDLSVSEIHPIDLETHLSEEPVPTEIKKVYFDDYTNSLYAGGLKSSGPLKTFKKYNSSLDEWEEQNVWGFNEVMINDFSRDNNNLLYVGGLGKNIKARITYYNNSEWYSLGLEDGTDEFDYAEYLYGFVIVPVNTTFNDNYGDVCDNCPYVYNPDQLDIGTPTVYSIDGLYALDNYPGGPRLLQYRTSSWNYLSTPYDFDTNSSIFYDNGVLYASFIGGTETYLYKYENMQWEDITPLDVNLPLTAVPMENPFNKDNSGSIYYIYGNESGDIRVVGYNSVTTENFIDSPLFLNDFTPIAYDFNLSNNNAYLGVKNDSGYFIFKYNYNNQTWTNLGFPVTPSPDKRIISLKFNENDNLLYVAYKDILEEGRIKLWFYDQGLWHDTGLDPELFAFDMDIFLAYNSSDEGIYVGGLNEEFGEGLLMHYTPPYTDWTNLDFSILYSPNPITSLYFDNSSGRLYFACLGFSGYYNGSDFVALDDDLFEGIDPLYAGTVYYSTYSGSDGVGDVCEGGGVYQNCGNNIIEGTEVCDGTDLNSETCISRGFASGNLSCSVNCLSFDTSQCVSAPSTGGGGGCTNKWSCSVWSECFSQGFQTRVCSYTGSCSGSRISGKPSELQDCVYVPAREVAGEEGVVEGEEIEGVIYESVEEISDLDFDVIGAEGKQIKLKKNSITFFSLKNQQHTVKIKEITENKVIVIIQSEPVEVELEIGETKIVELNGEKIKVILEDIIDGEAIINLSEYQEIKEVRNPLVTLVTAFAVLEILKFILLVAILVILVLIYRVLLKKC